MAVFQPGPVGFPLRGRIGSTVIRSRRVGGELRQQRAPRQKASAKRQAVKQRMAALAAGWQSLSDAERDSWNAAALNVFFDDPGVKFERWSGWNLYQKINWARDVQGLPLVDTAALGYQMSWPLQVAAEPVVGSQEILLQNLGFDPQGGREIAVRTQILMHKPGPSTHPGFRKNPRELVTIDETSPLIQGIGFDTQIVSSPWPLREGEGFWISQNGIGFADSPQKPHRWSQRVAGKGQRFQLWIVFPPDGIATWAGWERIDDSLVLQRLQGETVIAEDVIDTSPGGSNTIGQLASTIFNTTLWNVFGGIGTNPSTPMSEVPEQRTRSGWPLGGPDPLVSGA